MATWGRGDDFGMEPPTLFPMSEEESNAFKSRTGWGAAGSGSRGAGGAALHYPMYLMSTEVVLRLPRLTAHQILKRNALLAVWNEAYVGRTFLVSHEWLGRSHPDPKGEKLAMLEGIILNLATGKVDIQPDWKEQTLAKSKDRVPGKVLEGALPSCAFWLDYASVPQVLDDDGVTHVDSDEDDLDSEGLPRNDVLDALKSIPGYVDRSAAVLVLAPTCQHREVSGRYCSYASWRDRGWCRLELCAALLARSRVRVIRCVSGEAAPELIYAGDAAFLPPGEGQFTCCELGHCVDKRAIACDKVRLFSVVNTMLEVAAEQLAQAGEAQRRRLLLCTKERYLRGFPQAAAAGGFAAPEVSVFKTWLRWLPVDNRWARFGAAPSLLHWAALAGNVAVIGELLEENRKGLNQVMPAVAPELGVPPLLTPVHVAAFSADGRGAAARALIDARADAQALAGGDGSPAMAYALAYGTVQQVLTLLKIAEPSALKRPMGRCAATAATLAVCAGPAKAPHLSLLLERRADVRAGSGGLAAVDAALLGACLKEDSDPDVVALLLSAGCSPDARLRPPFRSWRAAHFGARLLAWLAALRGRPPSARVAMLADAAGSTPLHFAARAGDVPIVQLLLEARATPSLRNSMGLTPLQLARRRFGGKAPQPVEALL